MNARDFRTFDPALDEAIRNAYARVFVEAARLPSSAEERAREVPRILIADSGNGVYTVLLTCQYTGSSWELPWDGTRQALEIFVERCALEGGHLVRAERARDGSTPWDAAD